MRYHFRNDLLTYNGGEARPVASLRALLMMPPLRLTAAEARRITGHSLKHLLQEVANHGVDFSVAVGP